MLNGFDGDYIIPCCNMTKMEQLNSFFNTVMLQPKKYFKNFFTVMKLEKSEII